MVHAVERFAKVDQGEGHDVTSIDSPRYPLDNIEEGVFGRMGWAVGVLEGGKDVVSDKIGTELRAHHFFENF